MHTHVTSFWCLHIDIIDGESKEKVKAVPVLLLDEHHAMKVYWRSGIIAPL
jgi:hypothetical protein